MQTTDLPNPFITNTCIQIWDDLHVEQPGFYRAFWTQDRASDIGSPVVGYCSSGGSHRSVKAAVAEALRLHPGTPVYRNGKRVKA